MDLMLRHSGTQYMPIDTVVPFFWKALINHTSDRVLPVTRPVKTVPRYDTDNQECHTLLKNTLRPGRNQVMAVVATKKLRDFAAT